MRTVVYTTRILIGVSTTYLLSPLRIVAELRKMLEHAFPRTQRRTDFCSLLLALSLFAAYAVIKRH